MDDIIVIILTLIVALFGVLNKKKKGATPKPYTEQANEPADFWDMIMEREPQPEPTIEQGVKPDPFVRAPDEESVVQEYQFSSKQEVETLVEDEPIVHKKAPGKEMVRRRQFSLKQAVIQSEILNRKYT